MREAQMWKINFQGLTSIILSKKINVEVFPHHSYQYTTQKQNEKIRVISSQNFWVSRTESEYKCKN